MDRERQLFGYELLCRPSLDATSCLAPDEQASARVLVTAVTDIGLQILTEGKPAFVNVTRALLLDGAPMALPPSSIVVELLETIEADPEVLQQEIVTAVRDQIGPVAALKQVVVVPGLPKTRSGKILRRTMRGIADGRPEPVPSTIEDVRVLEAITPLLTT